MKLPLLMLIGLAATTAASERRSFNLMGALGSMTHGTKLGTAIEVINAFSKVESFINDLRNLAPQVHQALNDSITDITNTIDGILDHIGEAIDPTAHHKRSFNLLGALGTMTHGTKLGTAIEVVNAFSKVESFINDLRNLAPQVHQALSASITDITNTIDGILDHIGQAIDPTSNKNKRSGFNLLGALGTMTHGTKLGTAIEVINAFSKVESFINDLKNLAPQVHQALSASITDITNTIDGILDHIGEAIDPTAHHKRSGFNLLGALGTMTHGTKLGTAIEVVNAFSKVESFINDLRNLAPQVHQALSASITDITNTIDGILDHIGQAIDPTSNKNKRSGFNLLGALGTMTHDTKLGTAIEVINAFSKVESFINDLKNLAPQVHQALNASITDITNTIDGILDHIGQAIDPTAHHKRSGFNLLGALGTMTHGTKLGTAIEVVNAFSKVERFINDLRNLAPQVHQALSASITDITNTIDGILDHIGQAIDPTSNKNKRSGFNLLGALGTMTHGTKLGTAIEVVNAFSKVERFINDLRNLAPQVHQALSASITDITNTIDHIIDHIGQAIDPTGH